MKNELWMREFQRRSEAIAAFSIALIVSLVAFVMLWWPTQAGAQELPPEPDWSKMPEVSIAITPGGTVVITEPEAIVTFDINTLQARVSPQGNVFYVQPATIQGRAVDVKVEILMGVPEATCRAGKGVLILSNRAEDTIIGELAVYMNPKAVRKNGPSAAAAAICTARGGAKQARKPIHPQGT